MTPDKRARAKAQALKNSKEATGKNPVASASTNLGADASPIWRFGRTDFAHIRWGWRLVLPDDLSVIVVFLAEMEKLTWKEILNQQTGGTFRRGQKHKFIPIGDCINDAQTGLSAMEMDDDSDSWFRFRLGGEKRLWGILKVPDFYPVWWDPKHEICPGDLRHS